MDLLLLDRHATRPDASYHRQGDVPICTDEEGLFRDLGGVECMDHNLVVGAEGLLGSCDDPVSPKLAPNAPSSVQAVPRTSGVYRAGVRSSAPSPFAPASLSVFRIVTPAAVYPVKNASTEGIPGASAAHDIIVR